MSVQLDPPELGFRRPFTTEVAETLRLKNTNKDPVAFKVKTTAPKQYCVRPNSGRIEAGEYVEVQVLLQAMKEDPPADTRCKDKFLVQSVAVPANQEFTNVASVWSNIEQTAKSSIQEKKIRVNFLPAGGNTEALATPSRRSTLGAPAQEDEPPAYSSPMSSAATPAQSSTGIKSENIKSEPNIKTEPKGFGETVVAGSSAAAGAVAGAVTGAAASVAAAMPKSSEDLNAQLQEAKAQIAKLTSQVQEQGSGLRQRNVGSDSKTKSSSTSSAAGMQQTTPNGVPVPITAALCLFSFLLAYLLF